MKTRKIIPVSKIIHFLLVFIAIAREVVSNPIPIRSTCKVSNITKSQLKIEENPINFRNSAGNRNDIQMLLRLEEISKDVKDCMDQKKFNLTINLNEPLSKDHLKVGSIATQHIVSVGNETVGIESCTFDGQKVSG